MNESKLWSFKFLVNEVVDITDINFWTVIEKIEITLKDTI